MTTLYKFLPQDRTTYFDDALLRFTPPGALNDPYECLPAYPEHLAEEALTYVRKKISTPPSHSPGTPRKERRRLEREYKNVITRDNNVPRTIQAVREKYYERMTKKMNDLVGILSLSRRWNISLMWAHYTVAHSGFCIGFDKNHAFFQEAERINNENFPVAPVIYTNERSIVPDEGLTVIQARSILLTKAREWSYEEEERLVLL